MVEGTHPAPSKAIGVICSAAMRARCFTPESEATLAELGTLSFLEMEEPSTWTVPPPFRLEAERATIDFASGKDALIIGPGSPRITARILASAPTVGFVGELEGDRFALRIDMEAATERSVVVVDTSHGSSYPVAEWALALSIIGLRNAGELFRRLIAGQVIERDWKKTQPGYFNGELSRKRMGILGCGYIGRHLISLLQPFHTTNLVYDPYAPRLLSDVLDFDFCGLDDLMARSDVIICTLPLTDRTKHLLGETEINLMKPGAVFVNVGRGSVVDMAALTRRLHKGDIIACLDVYDPEPIPHDAILRQMANVFLSPHIAGVTADAGPRFVNLVAEELARHFQNLSPRSQLVPRQ